MLQIRSLRLQLLRERHSELGLNHHYRKSRQISLLPYYPNCYAGYSTKLYLISKDGFEAFADNLTCLDFRRQARLPELNAAKLRLIGLRDLQRRGVVAQREAHAAQPVALHELDVVDIDQRATMNL